MSILVVTVIR